MELLHKAIERGCAYRWEDFHIGDKILALIKVWVTLLVGFNIASVCIDAACVQAGAHLKSSGSTQARYLLIGCRNVLSN